MGPFAGQSQRKMAVAVGGSVAGNRRGRTSCAVSRGEPYSSRPSYWPTSGAHYAGSRVDPTSVFAPGSSPRIHAASTRVPAQSASKECRSRHPRIGSPQRIQRLRSGLVPTGKGRRGNSCGGATRAAVVNLWRVSHGLREGSIVLSGHGVVVLRGSSVRGGFSSTRGARSGRVPAVPQRPRRVRCAAQFRRACTRLYAWCRIYSPRKPPLEAMRRRQLLRGPRGVAGSAYVAQEVVVPHHGATGARADRADAVVISNRCRRSQRPRPPALIWGGINLA